MAENHQAQINKDTKYWLRWIIVLPVSLLTSIAATFPLHWVLLITLSNFVDPYPQLPERILTPFVIAAVFIWAGFRIAPEYKLQTSFALFGLWMFLLGGVVFLTFSGADWMGRRLYFQSAPISPIMAIAGALTGIYISWRIKGFGTLYSY